MKGRALRHLILCSRAALPPTGPVQARECVGTTGLLCLMCVQTICIACVWCEWCGDLPAAQLPLPIIAIEWQGCMACMQHAIMMMGRMHCKPSIQQVFLGPYEQGSNMVASHWFEGCNRYWGRELGRSPSRCNVICHLNSYVGVI